MRTAGLRSLRAAARANQAIHSHSSSQIRAYSRLVNQNQQILGLASASTHSKSLQVANLNPFCEFSRLYASDHGHKHGQHDHGHGPGPYIDFHSEDDEVGFLPKKEVIYRVVDVVKCFENVDPNKVTETSHFKKDLGLDSLDTVELMIAIEDEFNIEVLDDDADKMESVADVIHYIQNNINAQ
mmetsp:Transcript_16199/g.28373  ORF Transcript_16199/g.28373 Transcript_16199/m.28373 type:complete len:183 (-) Transcript_16199:133-681(-)